MTTTTCKVDAKLADELEAQYQKRLDHLQADLLEKIPRNNNHTDDTTTMLLDDNFLVQSSDLDYALCEFCVLKEATPKGLAAFAATTTSNNNNNNQELVDRLLKNPKLMQDMLIADGAKGGQYGRAMQIYTDILQEKRQQQQCSSSSSSAAADDDDDDATTIPPIIDESKRSAPVLDRLALAIALEHAVPVRVDPAPDDKNNGAADEIADPVQRYLTYELAFLRGELDPDFIHLSVWNLRMVVDGDEPDEIAVWGRRMLRNYRPDQVLMPHNAVWRYVELVRSNVRYGSQHVKRDRKELQRYQNILMNGGICGRRAFIGRFILRAFGVPTAARPSKGHGALCHWTRSNGWVVNLGPGWGAGWTRTLYGKDVNFRASSQARDRVWLYRQVKRAQWIGDVVGEKRAYGGEEDCGFWNSVALRKQQEILNKKGPPPGLLGASETYQPTIAQQLIASSVSPEAKKIRNNGSEIFIPAAGFQGGKNNNDAQVMTSFNGGLQVYMTPFAAKGLTILRGGTWKSGANQGCDSGSRLKSGGYGKYGDWGFRVALSIEHCNTKADANGDYPTLTLNLSDEPKVTMEMVYVKPGSFIMGGENSKDDRFACVEVPKHPVEITEGFYIGKYPITQAQYKVVQGNNPSSATKDPNCPVDSIGEEDALDFCRTCTEYKGYCVRLPTEAEWEYSARAGTDTKWFFGDDPSSLGEYAWFKDNSGGKPHPVGQKKPNPFGLYDVYGNVYERVGDKYSVDYYKKSPTKDPTGPNAGTSSILHYKVTAEQAGEYSLTAEVCTVNYNQQMKVVVEGEPSSEKVINLPFTCGDWMCTETTSILLQQGENVLHIFRSDPPQYGIAVSSFRVTYVGPSSLLATS